jgi:manganese transport system ATP-binding protein
VVLINRSILAYGDTSEVFTEENLSRTFGGSLADLPMNKSRVAQRNQEMQE